MIDKDFSFHKNGWDIPTTQKALEYYNANKKEHKDWLFDDSGTKIFLDTNVLINLYTISKFQRSQMLKFLKKNKSRIYLTKQVSDEYLKHRLSKAQGIRDAYRQLTIKYQENLDNAFKNLRSALSAFIDFASKSIINDDLPDSSARIQKMREKLTEKFAVTEDFEAEIKLDSQAVKEDLIRETEQIISELQYEYIDPILDVIAQLQVLPALDDKELKFLHDYYDTLLEEFNAAKTDNVKKISATFPGCGDRKKIADGEPPYGDFIIYHEMLKFIKETPQDILFITRDITKSDWVRTDKRPFVHYLIDIYSHTERMIYIIPANDFFPLSFTSLTPEAVGNSIKDSDSEKKSESNIETTIQESEDTVSSVVDTDTISEQDENQQGIKPQIDLSSYLKEYINSHLASTGITADDLNIEQPEYLRDITEDRFISELNTAIRWAKVYGNNYISENLFIYDILKSKRFRYASSRNVLDNLIAKGKITRKTENHEGKTIPCLYFTKDNRKKI
ncbi:PIN-like domain-containing protein [Muribaculum intestinale]|uniref:PIN-like domain-containing protein n=1 Tax=Muribaculum intestinale TaxID=1796646 RepID=UPI0025A95A9C|nr:PIN-like domain-containing protein [Muribaculum intestinale]